MSERLESAAVLGAGVMGSAIAAHLAGAGIKTLLLDMVPKGAGSSSQERSALAMGGIQGALKAKPAAFYDPDAARLVTPGNFDDDLAQLKDVDLVIEAVIERIDIKKELFGRVAQHVGPNTLVASNTSGLSIADIGADLPASVQERFVVMHFFNPVRYMRLLEIVPGPWTSQETVQRATNIGEFLGKGVVYGKDTPNFVANRIGVFDMMNVIQTMQSEGLTIEQVDKIMGKPMGRPKSACFRTGDVVGLDTLLHVANHCYDALTEDEFRETFKAPGWVNDLVKSGRTGQKTKAGFYRKQGKNIEVLDIDSLEYREQQKVRFEGLGEVKGIEDTGDRVKALIAHDDDSGRFAWKCLSRSLCYAAMRVGEISDDIVNIDNAIKWGFNWEMGPFEVWDAIGVPESVLRMQQDGLTVPQWVVDMVESGRRSFYDGVAKPTFYDVGSKSAKNVPIDSKHIRMAALHEDKSRIVKENMGASLVDLGDGCLAVEVHTKMNTIDGDVVAMLDAAVDEAEKNFSAIVIGNDGDHFGAGANLMLVYMAAQQQQWGQIDDVVMGLQKALQRLRYAKVPVVAAPFQYTFGGMAEVAMAADVCQAHAETYMGLVEVGVGLLPAGTGCMRMAQRWTQEIVNVPGADVLPFIGQASLNIAKAEVGQGAEAARRLRYLLPTDGISLNSDRLLYEAKARALGMAASGYRPERPTIMKAAGFDAAKTIGMQIWGLVEGGFASEHDALIANKVVHVLCGGHVAAGTELSEQHYLDLEREAFMSLCGEEKSQARMQSILMTNKPLRN